MSEIEIRPLSTMSEIRQVEALQHTIWQMNAVEIIPAHTMHALQHSGALLLGAFDQDVVVGFVFGVLGMIDAAGRIDPVAAARLKMYSVIMGVSPTYQKQNIGYRLKLAQRDFALKIGIRLITWTYDPLESLNAHFNVSKLGIVCQRYLRDFHGQMGGINASLATDRFEAEWWITGNRVKSRVTHPKRPLRLDALIGGGAVIVNQATFNEAGLPVPPMEQLDARGSLILVEIPAHFQALKRQDPTLAQQWRTHTRYLFEACFRQRFLVTDFVNHQDENDQPRSFYLLTHQDA